MLPRSNFFKVPNPLLFGLPSPLPPYTYIISYLKSYVKHWWGFISRSKRPKNGILKPLYLLPSESLEVNQKLQTFRGKSCHQKYFSKNAP